jgi:outer membrane lipoprotein LolB
MKAALACTLGALLLTACAGPQSKAPGRTSPGIEYSRHSQTVSAWSDWGLTGRLGLDDGQDGGSGRLDWQVSPMATSLDFRGTLGRGAWRLTTDSSGATLLRADGSEIRAAGIAELVIGETGLDLPVEALQWWVRGLPQPGADYRWQFNEEGLLAELEQLGWHIRYERYMDHAQLRLPRRLSATDGRQNVNLAVSQWRQGAIPGDA